MPSSDLTVTLKSVPSHRFSLGQKKVKTACTSDRQRCRRQIEHVDSESGVARVGVVRGLPAIDAPVHAAGREQNDPQGFVARDAARFVVESPAEDLPDVFIHQIALHRLRRLVEDLAVTNRAPQLDVLGMSPDQRASGAGRLSAK